VLGLFLAILIDLRLGPNDFIAKVDFLDVIYADADQLIIHLVAGVLAPNIFLVKKL